MEDGRNLVTNNEMSLIGHLDELRRRVIYCAVTCLLGTVIAYYLYDPWILNLLRAPIDIIADRPDNPFVWSNPLFRLLASSSAGTEIDLHFIGATEVFAVKLRVSFFAGMILTSPFILAQVWMFVAAGLTAKECGAIRMFIPASFGLFMIGVLIAYTVMVPIVLYFLVIVIGRGVVPMLIISKYVSLVVMCCLGFGLTFEMPLVILLLTKLGLITPQFLVAKRRYAILLIFIVGAILTPPDVITQMLMALPMIALYEASILISKIAWARRQKGLGK